MPLLSDSVKLYWVCVRRVLIINPERSRAFLMPLLSDSVPLF